MNQPEIRELGSMKVIGIGGNFISILSPDNTNMPVIPKLWDEYGERMGEIPGGEPTAGIGVVMGVPEGERTHPRELHYIAGHEVDSLDLIPEGMEGRTIPPATYAVFTHHGPITRLGETYGHIYGEWLPSSGYARTDGPEFELYDARFRHDEPDSEMDIYIPVAPKEG